MLCYHYFVFAFVKATLADTPCPHKFSGHGVSAGDSFGICEFCAVCSKSAPMQSFVIQSNTALWDCCRIAFLSLFVQNNPYFCVAKTTILPLGNSPLKPNKVALGHLRKKAVYCLAEHYSFLTVSFSGKPAFRRKIPSFLCLKHGVQASEIRLVASEKALFLLRSEHYSFLTVSFSGKPAFRRKIPSFLCLKHGVQASEIRLVASEKALFLLYRISSWQLLSLSLVGRLVRSLARLSTRS